MLTILNLVLLCAVNAQNMSSLPAPAQSPNPEPSATAPVVKNPVVKNPVVKNPVVKNPVVKNPALEAPALPAESVPAVRADELDLKDSALRGGAPVHDTLPGGTPRATGTDQVNATVPQLPAHSMSVGPPVNSSPIVVEGASIPAHTSFSATPYSENAFAPAVATPMIDDLQPGTDYLGERVVSVGPLSVVTPVAPKGTGLARLHLYVPSGAYVTINDQPTRNRVWDKHRHFQISGIPPAGKKVTIRVGLRKELSECGEDCKKGGLASKDCCGHELQSCCKEVMLRPGDEEYLSFSGLINSGKGLKKLPKLSFSDQILGSFAFARFVATSEPTGVTDEHSVQAPPVAAEVAPTPIGRRIRAERILETNKIYNSSTRVESFSDSVTETFDVPGQEENCAKVYQRTGKTTAPFEPTDELKPGTTNHTKETWIETYPKESGS